MVLLLLSPSVDTTVRVCGEEIWFLAQPKIPRELGRLGGWEVPMSGALLRCDWLHEQISGIRWRRTRFGLKFPTVRDLADVTCNVLRRCFWDSGPEPPNLLPTQKPNRILKTLSPPCKTIFTCSGCRVHPPVFVDEAKVRVSTKPVDGAAGRAGTSVGRG